MRRLLGILCLFAVLAPARGSGQSTIYSTFGAGGSYDASRAHSLVELEPPPRGQGGYNAIAFNFDYSGPSGDMLSTIRFVGGDFYALSPLNVQFLTGASIASATVLESWILPADPSHRLVYDQYQIYTLSSLLSPVLITGESYWVRWFGGGLYPTTVDFWNLPVNNLGVLGGEYALGFTEAGGGAWQYVAGTPAPAFDVTSLAAPSPTDVVPEPSTLALLATGLVGLAGVQRKRAHAKPTGNR